jgi:TonB family protein
MMKKVLLLILCTLAASSLCLAGTDAAGQQLLVDAVRQANIFSDDASPFQLEIDFQLQIQVPGQGHLTLKRESKDRWWRRVTVAALQETDIRKGDRLYTSRNAPFTPVRVTELISLISLVGDPDQLQAKKTKRRVEKGVEVACIEVQGAGQENSKHEVCLNPDSHELLSDAWEAYTDDHRRAEYSDYFEFRGHRYPRKINLFVNGSKVIEAQVASLVTAPLDEKLLVLSAEAIERRQCDGIKHPVPIKTPDPSYPESARQNRLIGDTMVSMTVLPDGAVDNIQLIGKSSHAMDNATLQILRTWKFKPAMCGAEPVTYDIQVVVSFRLY